MFEQHPVPQQISSYQFRLVGDMTLKQFFQLAGGAVVGLLIYATPLPAIFKWPLIVFFVVAGAAFAFLPLQERPLSEWISAFFRAVYGPTLFIWTTPQKNVYFAPEEGASPASVSPTRTSATSPELINDVHEKKLEEKETTILNRVTDLFSFSSKSSAPQTVAPTTMATNTDAPVEKAPVVESKTPQVLPNTGVILSEVKAPTPMPIAAPVTPTRQAVETPQLAPVKVENKAGFQAPEVKAQTLVPNQPTANDSVNQTFTPTNTPPAVTAQFSPEAAPPTPPTSPNIVVGQVMDVDGKIVSSAIIEIKDQMGRPVRALRTNQAGHFMIVTPLSSGTYKIFTEKDNLIFDPVSLETKGAILPPVAIRARNKI